MSVFDLRVLIEQAIPAWVLFVVIGALMFGALLLFVVGENKK